MSKQKKIPVFSAVVYCLLFVLVLYLAFIFQPNNYSYGKAKGAAIGLLLIWLWLYSAVAILVYKETKNLKTVIKALHEVTYNLMLIPEQISLVKRIRRIKKRFFKTRKKEKS